ncbi:MAG: hypothetical protein OXC48_09895, partial [Endozoicomonadaceae bacterium]|nr:hypothetical protein [Endozoicomonadaceae bacterium]
RPSVAEADFEKTTSGSTKPISVEFTLIHPPFNPKTAEELFEGSSFSFYDKASKTLKPDSLKNVVNIWAVLRNSPFHENIACDTGCILLAYQIAGKDLKIKSLDIFLSMRNKYINYEGSFSKEHPYIVALNNVFEGIRDHSHPGNIREYNIGNYNASKLSRIFTYYRYMLIQGYNHMVILKHAGYDNWNRLWKVYQFFSDSDNLIIRHVNTRNLNRQIFRNKDDKFSFIGYIGIMR